MKITEDISAILLVLMGTAIVGGVALFVNIESNGTQKASEMPFVTLMRDGDGEVVYDKRTGVEYFKSRHGIEALIDKDGKPMIYNEE